MPHTDTRAVDCATCSAKYLRLRYVTVTERSRNTSVQFKVQIYSATSGKLDWVTTTVTRSIDVTSAWVLAFFQQDTEQKDFIKLKLKFCDFHPQEWLTWWLGVTLVLVHKTNGILAVTMELSIIGIWCIASASNLSINSITRHLACFTLQFRLVGTSSNQINLVVVCMAK